MRWQVEHVARQSRYPLGTYTVNVTATSGAIMQSTSVTVEVN
jgi:fluoride ion exporter CrcB/FEX